MKKLAYTAIVLALASGYAPSAHADFVRTDETRTQGRSVEAYQPEYPDSIMNRPEHYEFLPETSNFDPQNDHPAQWQGQEWDTAKWPAGWTADSAVDKFFENGTLTKIYRKRTWRPSGQMLEVDVGATFWKLSELDQQRVMELLCTREHVFDNGYKIVELRDHVTKRIVGTYTAKGLQLY